MEAVEERGEEVMGQSGGRGREDSALDVFSYHFTYLVSFLVLLHLGTNSTTVKWAARR